MRMDAHYISAGTLRDAVPLDACPPTILPIHLSIYRCSESPQASLLSEALSRLTVKMEKAGRANHQVVCACTAVR